MVLKTFLFVGTLCTFSVLSAPLSAPVNASAKTSEVVNPTTSIPTSTPVSSAVDSILLEIGTLVPSPSSVTLQSTLPSLVLSVTALPSVFTQTAIEVLTDTITVTDPPTTVTVSAAPSTVTEIITLFPTPTSTQAASSTKAWTAPAQMSDLASFNISAFPGGQRNLQIVQGIPATASASTFAIAAETTADTGISLGLQASWDNSTSVLQLLYPANSIDPANKPQGGAEFYATPLQMDTAQNITLEYSIFFPVDFDWVQAGKLPGLYGGHTGCSGGDDAVDCFSTRLMWRQNGAGELYLYAPKDKQTAALCDDPRSVCDAAYGLSIGRGSFNFTPGAWTHLQQTVVLNTPGKQDGSFTLMVNGGQTINRTDIFYRDIPPPPPSPSSQVPSTTDLPAPVDTTVPKAAKAHHKPSSPSDGGGLLGGLLGGLIERLPILGRQYSEYADRPPLLPSPTALEERPGADAVASALIAGYSKRGESGMDQMPMTATATVTETATGTTTTATLPAMTVTTQITSTAGPPLATPDSIDLSTHGSTTGQPVGFIGLFFSTFFGGHTQQYATPRDQYTWFKDFSMTSNG